MQTALLRSFASHPLRLLAAALLLLAPVSARPAQTEERVAFANSIGALPAKAAPTVRPLAVGETAAAINFNISLKMRNFAHLQERVARGETIPAAELDAAYLPLPNDYAALKKWLLTEGFTIRSEDTSRLIIFARGTVAQVQNSLQTKMVGVTVKGVNYTAASTAPSLPASVTAPVLSINGLQPYHHLHTHLERPQAASVSYKIDDILTTYDAADLGVIASFTPTSGPVAGN